MSKPQFTLPPPAIPDDMVRLTFPAPHVLHIAMNRPKAYNAMSAALNATLADVFDWYEAEPSLWVAVLGSTNRKAWCAGADLKEWKEKGKTGLPRNGIAGLTERFTRKPVIGAINGVALGGGCEIVVNLDIGIAGESAIFGFPEAKRGVSIAGGGLQRFVKIVGHQKAVECVLTGRNIPAAEALQLRMINEVVPDDKVEERALELAKMIAGNSPDSVVAGLYGIRLAGEHASARESNILFVDSAQYRAVNTGENIKEGLLAFQERREPKWVPSKL